MKKKLYAVILAVALLASGCSPMNVYNNEERIADNSNSYNKIRYKQSTKDDTTTITCGKMEGMDTVWKYQAEEDTTLQMCCTLEVTSGKAKLVLIQPDDTIITLAEKSPQEEEMSAEENDDTTSTAESMSTLELKKGSNRMKIVCEKDTSFSLSFTVSKD